MQAHINPLEEKKVLGEEFGLEFWNLSQTQAFDHFNLDYRVSENLKQKETIAHLHQHLQYLYTGSVGVEFDHISSEYERLWLFNAYEEEMTKPLTKSE